MIPGWWKKKRRSTGVFQHEIKNFPVYRQKTDHTCGPACVRIILQSQGLDIPESKIAARCLTHPWGTLPWTLISGFRSYAEKLGISVDLSENDDNVYDRIKESLQQQKPVMFVYAVIDDFHPPGKVLHYGVLAGVDEPGEVVKIANPFGRIEFMPIGEWWDRFSLLPEYLSFFQRSWVMAGLVKPRTAFFLTDIG